MMMLIFIGGGLIGIIFLYFLTIALIPWFKAPRQQLTGSRAIDDKTSTDHPENRKDVSFEVKGTSIHAWLYLPADTTAKVACIVMANGTGGTKNMLLKNYARRFQAAGFAVLSFDYRYFGQSGGRPRQLIWIPHQLEDYSAAIDYARNLAEIDSTRVALWGTSLSGGHVITMAARDKRIAGVVAQCPSVDGRAAAKAAVDKFGIRYILRMVINGQRDYIRGLLGFTPHKIPIVANPGSIGLMTTPDAFTFFKKYVPSDYINEACARIILRGDKYRPIKYARDVRCPVLLQICEHDSIIPKRAAEETVMKLGKYAEAIHYPIGHFDIYIGDNFEKAVGDQLNFLRKHL
jgi:uncharacterized protein